MADQKDFSKLMAELEEIVAWFEREDVDLDKALPKFERGMKVAGELKKYLEDTENKVEKIKQKFDQEATQEPTETGDDPSLL